MNLRRGFTLIELIVSILIFSLAMTGIVVFTAHNSRTSIESERKARSVILQESSLEELRRIMRHHSQPGRVFDSLWENFSAGHVVYTDTDASTGITCNIEIAQFIPDVTADPDDPGSRIRLRVITVDNDLNRFDTTRTIISKHR